jgi:pyruvate/2-oxoacid:ferredoxin oxidoreductase alpha subunit
MWRCVLFAGFPITPSTKWIETVAARIAKDPGIRRVKLLEAEHAVADYLVGAAASCRDLIFPTATSSVGLDHMTETTRSLGASGLGNVMIIDVYRATANFPLCIEGDPSDTFAHRDDGFIQIVARGAQQIYDTVIQAPCLGMHPDIMTPTMPGYYGIKDSHRSAGRLDQAVSPARPDQRRHRVRQLCHVPPFPGLQAGPEAALRAGARGVAADRRRLRAALRPSRTLAVRDRGLAGRRPRRRRRGRHGSRLRHLRVAARGGRAAHRTQARRSRDPAAVAVPA